MTEICPKCGAIAEKNAYYGRITCTSCDWEGPIADENSSMKNVTEKFSNAISGFAADFEIATKNSAKDSGYITLKLPVSNRLLNDIELLSELECKLRYGQLQIIEPKK